MFRQMLKSKVHRLTVTDADLNYEGSLTLDSELMSVADLKEYEKVAVLNVTNGHRFETYLIKGESGSGVVCINGAAARLVQKGDIIIVISYLLIDYQELKDYKPIKIFVDSQNRIKKP